MYENIERIKAPSREVFFNEYLLKQKPVIITNLFEGQPIAELSSLDVAKKKLGDMPVLIQEGYETYLSRMLRMVVTGNYTNADLERERSTVNGYLALVDKDPKTRKVCAEVPQDMIGAVERSYTVPDYCKPAPGEPDEYLSMLWLGNAGNHTHLHYDSDYRNILQYQLWGEKRALLVTPQHAKKLLPLGNNSALSPEQLSESESEAFVKYVDGYQAVVRTGETLFMPSMIWHYFEYVDTSMALTMRFHRNKYIRYLSDKLHTDYRTQAISWKFVNDRALTPELREVFAEIEREYNTPSDDPSAKGLHMQQVIERIYDRLCTDSVKGEWSRPLVDVLRETYRNVEIMAGGLYNTPAAT